jgi:hypothetical protein
MEMLHVPARVVTTVQIHEFDHLVDRRTPVRNLLEPFVSNAI